MALGSLSVSTDGVPGVSVRDRFGTADMDKHLVGSPSSLPTSPSRSGGNTPPKRQLTPVEVAFNAFNTQVDAWAKKGEMERAQKIVDEQMIAKGVKPNAVTFSTLVDGWVKKGAMDKATEVVEWMIKRKLSPNEVTYSSLANGWVKKGCMDRAQVRHTSTRKHRCSPIFLLLATSASRSDRFVLDCLANFRRL